MAVFGGYETVRELYRSGLASASTARQVGGDGAERFVVKCYKPHSIDGSDELVQREIDTFLDGARAQQEVAAGGAAHWAAVREVGTVEGGAYFVTDYHRRSVQHLIRGRVRLSGGGLCRIVLAVVRGLIELRTACRRPHGNLKPSNILLTGTSDVRRAAPLLTDPAGVGHLDPKAGDVPDLHAVGELIYQLVLHRTGKAMGGYPAPDSKEWGALGKNGTAWRQLCNRLLNPNLAPGLLSFEDLAEDVEKLRERVGGPSVKVVVAASLAAMVVVAAIVIPWIIGGNNGEQVRGDFDPEAWERLETEFSGWVEPLLAQYQNRALSGWESDEHLKKNVLPIVPEIIGRIKEINPRLIAKYSGNRETVEAIEKTKAALKTIERLRDGLSEKGWPARRDLAKDLRDLRGDPNDPGWDRAAEYLASLEPFRGERLAERVSAVLAARRDLTRIGEKWKTILGIQKKLETWGQGDVKPLSRLGEYILGETAVPPDVAEPKCLAKLLEKLSDLLAAERLPRQLEAYIDRPSPPAKPLDWSLVRADPPFAVPADQKMTDTILREGRVKLVSGHYDIRPDPRTAEWKGKVVDGIKNIKADIGNVGQRIAKAGTDLVGLAKALPSDSAQKLKGLNGEHKDIGAASTSHPTELRGIEDSYKKVISIPVYDADHRAAVDKGKAQVDSSLKTLTVAVSAAAGRIRKLEDDIAALMVGTLEQERDRLRRRPKIAVTGLAQIDEQWLKRRDELLKTDTTPAALSEQSKRLESALLDLEGRFTNEPVIKEDQQRQWNRALVEQQAELRRGHAVATCLSFVDWQKVLAGQEDANFLAMRDDQVNKYNAWRAGVAQIVPAFNRIEEALEAGYLLAETPPAMGMTLGESYAQQQKAPVFGDPAVSAAVQAMVARLEGLRQLGDVADPQRLLALVNAGRQGSFELARAAWLRLGRLSKPWPSSPAELKQEIEARKNLSALYGLLGDAGRKAALQQELAAENPGRWEAYFVNLSDVGQIEDAVGRMAEFGAKPDAQLSPLARFRLGMYRFRGDVSAQPDKLPDAQVKTIMGDFLAKLQGMPAEFRGRSDVSALVGALEKIRTEPGGGGVDVAKAGPAGLGHWRARQDGDTVIYSWQWQPGKTEELTFREITTTGGKRCFLCTTEVSVGLFMRVVLDPNAPKWAEMSKLLLSDDDKYGPRVWTGGTAMAVNSSWLAALPPPLVGKMYAAGTDPGPVAPEHPMQQISFAAATYFARLMNCRLPTSAEWLAAYRADKAAASAKPHNLRDKTWQAQKNYAAKLEDDGDLMDREQYFPDAGVFWPKSIAVADRKIARDAEVKAQAATDGYLWFAKVGSDNGRQFQHLVGNVAEYVYDDPDTIDKLKAMTPESIQGLLKAGGAPAGVIGGSAMSAPPPQVAEDKRYELAAPAGKEGFSDVGFRLAFLAGPGRLQDRVLTLLKGTTNEGYLSATP